ncbi:MAG: DUF401 family protein [Acidaminococcaceae bacterium]|nr:DUF401 family protein [Acidaminococcaceae bacterium]MDD4721291.1 DUF401 family protein [Acidaminococcaceae bacterium]
MWAIKAPDPIHFITAGYQTFTMQRTYDLLFALYFVMCLEIELRTSGTLDGMVRALQRLFPSEKFTLAIMPAFLGLLPSLGGARFSAPIVETASKGTNLSAAAKSSINFYFRHIFEYSNPINPGMIMACSIAMLPISKFVIHLGWLSIVAFALGWIFCIRPLKLPPKEKTVCSNQERCKNIADVALSLAPVIINFLLVVFFHIGAAVSMGLVVFGMIFLLQATNRTLNVKNVFLDSLDIKMLLNVVCIFYFIQLLTVTEILSAIVTAFNTAPLPPAVIIACVSFIIGVLTGLSQGHVAIVLPIVAAMAPGNIDLFGVAMVFGIAGQMITPTHVCLMVTLDYFKADFFKTLKPVALIEVLILIIFSIVTYFSI